MSTEVSGYLPTNPPLYAMAHRAAEAPRGVVVICAPFAEEKKAAQRALVAASRHFAAANFDVLRFDFRGTGDSGGEFGESDVQGWLADLRAAVEQARLLSGDAPVTLLGLRFGAALAWLAAADEALPIDNLVLWEPIVSGATYVRQNRQRSQIRAQMTQGAGQSAGQGSGEAPTPAAAPTTSDTGFDFDGFWVGEALHQQMAQVDLLQSVPRVKRLLLLQISGSPRLKKPFEDLKAHATAAGVAVDADSVAVEAFWSSIGLIDTSLVRERTLAWLEQNEGAAGTREVWQPAAKALVAPDVQSEAFAFESGNEMVRGVIYQPAGGPAPSRAVMLLHGWSGYRVGPGQLLSEAAREIARAGFVAFSFDFRGRGESQLEVAQASLNTMIRDATRAAPLMRDKLGTDNVTLLGLCSGGEVALGASLSEARIDSLALWLAPVFSGAFTLARQAARSRSALKKYVRKLFLPETYTKLFGGQLNWKMIVRALSGGRSNEDAGVQDKAPDTQSQMQAFEAFKGRLLFVYGGNDPETAPSRAFYQEFIDRTQMPAQFHEIAGANHNFYSVDWHRELIGLTVDWLKTLDAK